MIYELIFIGGPKDGQEVLSPRPYDAIQEPDGHVYSADAEGDACVERVDERTGRITLRHRGRVVPFPPDRKA
jgi:hypothetical protein